MGSGRIVSVIGAVIDVEFSRDEVPQVYDALKIEENGITLEVQQQLGDGVVRTIAMGSSEGIARGLAVANTSAPISVPVRSLLPSPPSLAPAQDASTRVLAMAMAATLPMRVMFTVFPSGMSGFQVRVGATRRSR